MKKILFLLFFFSLCSASANGSSRDDGLKIHFIDVGEGEAILIQAQGKNALVDTGNLLSGYKLVNYLKEKNVRNIDHIIITHHDLDHISGLFFVIPKFNVGNYYDNGVAFGGDDNPVLAWYEKIFRSKENYRSLREGDRLKLGDTTLEVIWPPVQEKPLSGSFNYNSLVIILSFRDFKCLLTADINSAVESELLKKGVDLKADMLKVAHHGAADATSEDFLNRTHPRFAVISVDKNNRRGYPTDAVLNLLRLHNIKTYRTDEDGSILLSVNDKAEVSFSVEKEK